MIRLKQTAGNPWFSGVPAGALILLQEQKPHSETPADPPAIVCVHVCSTLHTFIISFVFFMAKSAGGSGENTGGGSRGAGGEAWDSFSV